jgi:hypothetical protein
MVEKYGWFRVYEAGLELIGFPPTWDPSLKQLLAIKSYLEET